MGAVGVNSNIEAELLFRKREGLSETAFVEMVIWRVPDPVRGSAHSFKYRLALVPAGVCVLRYDNEAGKGDHKHLGENELPYRFIDLAALQADFWRTWQRGGQDNENRNARRVLDRGNRTPIGRRLQR